MTLLIFRPLLNPPPWKVIKQLATVQYSYNKHQSSIHWRQLATTQIRYNHRNEKKTTTAAITTKKYQSEISDDVKPLGERVKENTKTISYMGVIVLGVTVTGIMFFAIFRELMSSSSPNSVYSMALDRCVNEPKIQDALGQPIKGYGEETRRRRRQHVAHSIYERNGVKHMRMVFYVQGIRNKATVHLEVRQNSVGNYDYRYLFAQLDHYPNTTIILEDNRALDDLNVNTNSLMISADNDNNNNNINQFSDKPINFKL